MVPLTTDTLLVLGLNGLLMGKGFFNKMVPLTTDTLLVLGLNGLSIVMGVSFWVSSLHNTGAVMTSKLESRQSNQEIRAVTTD